MAIPYFDKARTAYGACAQQSSCAESENASLVPQALAQLSIVCSMYCYRRKAGLEPGINFSKYSM